MQIVYFFIAFAHQIDILRLVDINKIINFTLQHIYFY